MNNDEFQKYKKILTSCPLFNGMTDEELGFLTDTEKAWLVSCTAGNVLDSSYMYILLKGSVLIEKQASDGRLVTMGTALPGAAVNAASVFLSVSPMSRMTVQEDGLLLCIEGDLMHDTIQSGGRFSLNMVKFLSDKVYFLNKKITSLAGYSATSRLHLYLEEHNVNGTVTLPMSLTDFADYLGVGRASLYRTLDQLQHDGSIERHGRTIIIKNGII